MTPRFPAPTRTPRFTCSRDEGTSTIMEMADGHVERDGGHLGMESHQPPNLHRDGGDPHAT